MRYWHRTVQRAINNKYPVPRPLKILEVGMYQGGHTRQLLESYLSSTVTSIDTVRDECVDELEAQYGDRFVFVQDTSLQALPDLGVFDVVLLDGDHNRYTVYNELKLLYETHDPFPLVILHDVDGPWGRVDFSYNQNTIPTDEFGGGRQGVLSGVEDFISEHKSPDDSYYFKLTLHTLGPGLGVLEKIMGADI